MIQINWHNVDKTILTWTFRDTWTATEYLVAKLKFQKMMVSIEHDIIVISDMTRGQGPENLLEIATDAFRIPVANVKQVVIVGNLPTWKSLYSLLSHMNGEPVVPVKVVETLQQAEEVVIPQFDTA